MNMTSTFKSKLKEADRYTDIMGLIEDIINMKDLSFPLRRPYKNDNDNTVWRVTGSEVRHEAEHLRYLINHDSIGNTGDRFYALGAYVESISDSKLHNIAVTLTHRKEVDEDELDRARIWGILCNMIDCWNINEQGLCDWCIPDGWKRVN